MFYRYIFKAKFMRIFMKKSFLGLVALVPIVTMTACSDDSSSSTESTVSSSSSVVIDPVTGLPITNPVVDPSVPVTDPSIPSTIPSTGTDSSTVVPPVTDTLPTPVVPPEEDITQKPISDEEKAPDGSESVSTLAFDIKGVAELGPFKSGASVSISSVDAKTMTLTPGAGSSKVSDNVGSYTASGTLSSAIASVEVSGSYTDFTTENANTSASGLKALTDLRDRKKVNVNILTRLEYDRVQTLVGMGLSFTAAKDRAEKEVLTALGFVKDSTRFEDISLYDMNQAGQNLLAISTILLNERDAASVDAIISAIAADIGLDGTWDDEVLRAKLADQAYYLDIGYPTYVLSDIHNDADIIYYKGAVDAFWGAQYNLGTCGKNNQKELKPNGNSNSQYVAKNFICQDSLWTEVTDAQLADIAATQAFGECNESKAGTMELGASGQYFLCSKNIWKVADEADMKNMEIAKQVGACNSSSNLKVTKYESSSYMCVSGVWTKLTKTPVDYSKGRAMNKKLGAGVNFGNSWDSPGTGDGAWSNPIGDGDFAAVKAAGFNSIRLPVRWSAGVDAQLNGVKEDVQLALKAGLTVIVNSHHHDNLYSAAKNGSFDGALQNFASEWKKVAQAFDSFPDDALVFEIFNEPHDMTQDQVNKIMTTGYEAIRSVSKGKTIMFESNGYSKFAQIPKLNLPNDGNIIVSGHYYDPYTFTHQGHGYDCNGNAGSGVTSIAGHFTSYAEDIAMAFPDANGGSVPMNVGEFGVANKGGCSAVSDANREAWTEAVIQQAEKYGMSWHYWCYKNCGGFEASTGSSWHGNMLNVFKKYMK